MEGTHLEKEEKGGGKEMIEDHKKERKFPLGCLMNIFGEVCVLTTVFVSSKTSF